jgi:hypothetical protein
MAMRRTFPLCWACALPMVTPANRPKIRLRRLIQSPRRRGRAAGIATCQSASPHGCDLAASARWMVAKIYPRKPEAKEAASRFADPPSRLLLEVEVGQRLPFVSRTMMQASVSSTDWGGV